MGYSLRTEGYRYTVWTHDFTTRQSFNDRKNICGRTLCYQKDPLETINVVTDKEYLKIKRKIERYDDGFFLKANG